MLTHLSQLLCLHARCPLHILLECVVAQNIHTHPKESYWTFQEEGVITSQHFEGKVRSRNAISREVRGKYMCKGSGRQGYGYL